MDLGNKLPVQVVAVPEWLVALAVEAITVAADHDPLAGNGKVQEREPACHIDYYKHGNEQVETVLVFENGMVTHSDLPVTQAKYRGRVASWTRQR